jgi:hypothetical protein
VTSSSTRIRLLAIAFCFLCIGAVGANPVLHDVSVPGNAETGAPIPVSVNVTSDVPVELVQIYYQREDWISPLAVILNLTEGDAYNGTWSGALPAQEWSGSVEYSIVVNDGLGYYPPFPGKEVIEIEGPTESHFPWVWVIIGGFLVFVFIATELIFKPGFYRPTGRERARALEEEDRLREMEEAEKAEGHTGIPSDSEEGNSA